MLALPDFDSVIDASGRIRPHVHRTPVLTSATIDRLCRCRVYFKAENFQKAGAFKARGAHNAVFSLSEEEAARGVVTHSSGNHAQALALAAGRRGLTAHVVMPVNSSPVKIAAVRGYGGLISFCDPDLAARENEVQRIIRETGAVLIHPYDDPRVIAGQGTAALELFEEIEGLHLVLAPVGGGGLLSGTALAAAGRSPKTAVVGVEPEGADDARRSLEENRIVPSVEPRTIADGLLTSLGELTFPLIAAHVREIVTVSDEAVIRAMRFVWERMKVIIEPSAAVPVAAMMEGRVEVAGRRVGVILSGGNADLSRPPWLPAGPSA